MQGIENAFGAKDYVVAKNWARAGAGQDKAATDKPRAGIGVFSSAKPDAVGANKDQGAKFCFSAVLDIINPLHHIPIIGSLYRGITGDSIQPVARVAGGGLFFGALGAAGGVIASMIEHQNDGEEPLQQLAENLFSPDANESPDGAESRAAEIKLAATPALTPAAISPSALPTSSFAAAKASPSQDMASDTDKIDRPEKPSPEKPSPEKPNFVRQSSALAAAPISAPPIPTPYVSLPPQHIPAAMAAALDKYAARAR